MNKSIYFVIFSLFIMFVAEIASRSTYHFESESSDYSELFKQFNKDYILTEGEIRLLDQALESEKNSEQYSLSKSFIIKSVLISFSLLVNLFSIIYLCFLRAFKVSLVLLMINLIYWLVV